MANLSGGGAADNVDATNERITKASLELETFAAKVEQLRLMPGLLDLSGACDSLANSLRGLSETIEYFHSGLSDQPDSSFTPHRLANQIWHDGD